MGNHETVNSDGGADPSEEVPKTQWDELARTEFVGDTGSHEAKDVRLRLTDAAGVAFGLKELKPEEALVSADGFIDQQSRERQAEMRHDFANLELLRLDLKNASPDNHSEAHRDYVTEKFNIISRHLSEEDCVEYLMEVTGEPIEAVVSGMIMTDFGAAFNHFDHISEMLQDGFGEEAEQAAYNMFQGTATIMDMMEWDNLDVSVEPKFLRPDDYTTLFDFAGQRGLEVDDFLPFAYLRTVAAAGDVDDQEELFYNLSFLDDYGVRPEDVTEEFCRNGEFMAVLKWADQFDQFNFDVRQPIDDYVQEAISTPQNIVMKVLRNPKAYQDYGINIKQVLENNLPKVWSIMQKSGVTRLVAEKIAEVGVDLEQVERDYAELQIEIDTGFQEEFSEAYISQNNVPPEVRAEWQHSADMVSGRENLDRIRALFQDFTPDKWKNKERAEQEQVIGKYAEMLAENYNLSQPYELKLVPDGELNTTDNDGTGSSTYGQHKIKYILARDPSMQEYAEKMRQAGIETTWLYRSIVSINEDCLADGMQIADTVAHELRHAFQREQEFLWRMGYYDQKNPHGEFDYLPQLAQYFAANFQSGNYYEAKDSYTDYREQLVEADAFMLGEHYANFVELGEEPVAEGLTDQSIFRVIGQKIGNLRRKNRRKNEAD